MDFASWPQNAKILTVWPFTVKFANPLLYCIADLILLNI